MAILEVKDLMVRFGGLVAVKDVSFELNEKDKRMEFAVKDTGKGIPADKRETIFERFTKLDNFVQGTGLGLSICKTIEKIGGKIWVDPDYTEGACFRFYAPIRSESDTTSIN